MSAADQSAVLQITAYDGTRSPLRSKSPMVVNIFNISPNRTFNFQDSFKSVPAEIKVPFEDGPGDYYAVSAWVDGFQSAGFPTVHESAVRCKTLI